MKEKYIFCNDLKRSINKKDCFYVPPNLPCRTCPERQILKSSFKKEQNKIKYGKKSCTPKALCRDESSLSLYNDLKQKIESEQYTYDKLDIFLFDLGEKGVNLYKILNAMLLPDDYWESKTGKDIYEIDYRKKLKINYFEIEKKINKALNIIQNLSPVMTDFKEGIEVNHEISNEIVRLKKHIERYFHLMLIGDLLETLGVEFFGFSEREKCYQDDNTLNESLWVLMKTYPFHRLREWIKANHKPYPKQSDHNIWGKCIYELVEELKKIYSYEMSYKETAKLLNLFYPSIYKNTAPGLVKKRYNYHIRRAKKGHQRKRGSLLKKDKDISELEKDLEYYKRTLALRKKLMSDEKREEMERKEIEDEENLRKAQEERVQRIISEAFSKGIKPD